MFIFPYLKPYRKLLVAVLVLGTINQVFSLLDPQIFRWIADTYLVRIAELQSNPEGFYRGVGLGLLGMIGVAMVSRVAKNFQDYFANVMTQNMGMDIFSKTIAHAFTIPYKYLEDQSSGQLLQKLQKARTDIQTYILQLINTVFLAVISTIFVIVYAFTIHWLIGVILVLLFPLMGGLSYRLSQSIKKSQDQIVGQTAALSGATTETIRNISLVKILGLEKQELDRIHKANDGILELELQKIRKVRSMEFIQGTLMNAIRTALLGTMFWMMFQGSLTLGEFFSLRFYSFRLFSPLYQLGAIMKTYQEAKASHDVLQQVVDMEAKEAPEKPYPVAPIKEIRFEDVAFAYADQKDTLKGIDLRLEVGKNIAFVGPSGSGKSTLLKLLVGLYDASTGKVSYNGVDIQQYSLHELNKKIGIVTQDPQLFSGSIKDNLIFVKPDATDEDCMRVLEQAQLLSFIQEQKDGLATKIGEGGLKLSGGQKQRLAIARALLRDPEVLIFDEATSSLDSIIEKEITETMKQVAAHRSDIITISVAHRLSTIMHADEIYVLEKGSLSEQGTHESLLEQKGLYYALWREQIGERGE